MFRLRIQTLLNNRCRGFIINKKPMGNSSHVYIYPVNDPRSLNLCDFTNVEDLSYRKIWKHKTTGQYLEEYSIFTSTDRTLPEEMYIYQRRRQQGISLVSVHFVEQMNKQYSNSSAYRELRVFTEHIPVTLNHIASIPLPSALFFLKKAFEGFAALFKEVGYF